MRPNTMDKIGIAGISIAAVLYIVLLVMYIFGQQDSGIAQAVNTLK